MRKEFEKLPEIRDSISEHIVFIGNKYTTPNPDFYDLVNWLNGAWYAWQAKAQAVQEGFVLVPKEPSADLVNHGHQVFLGHFNEGGQTGGRSIYFAYKAMIEAQEQTK